MLYDKNEIKAKQKERDHYYEINRIIDNFSDTLYNYYKDLPLRISLTDRLAIEKERCKLLIEREKNSIIVERIDFELKMSLNKYEKEFENGEK